MTQAISENTTVLPALARRTVLGHIAAALGAAAASAAVASGASAAFPAAVDNSELVAFADRLRQLHPRIVDASERLEEAGEHYQAIKPERGKELNWRPGDAGLVRRYSNTAFCTDDSVDALRGEKFVSWEFTGTDEELDRLNLTYLGTSVVPVAGREHLFVSRVDERRQRRASELIAALDEFRAKNAVAIDRAGLKPLEDDMEALQDERDEITGRIIELKPKTLRGLQALARAMVYAEWDGDIRNRPSRSLEDEMVNLIICALSEQSLAP